MTIKDNGKPAGKGGEPEIEVPPDGGGRGGLVDQLEQEINVGIEEESETPMVAAILVDESTVVEASSTGAGKASASTLVSSMATAYPMVVAQPLGSNTTSVIVTPVASTNIPGNQPLSVPVNARWVKIRHIGPATWSTCTIVSVITCCFCLLPCGFWAFLCPCDEDRGYEVDGRVFSENGKCLGNIRNLRIRYT